MISARFNCTRCGARITENRVRRGFELCGICECVEAREVMTIRPAFCNAHWNCGLGRYIEDRDHLRKVREEMRDEGIIAGWD